MEYLRLHLCLDFDSMIGDSSGFAVLQLGFQAKNLAAKLQVLGQETLNLKFLLADLDALIRVLAGKFTVLFQKSLPYYDKWKEPKTVSKIHFGDHGSEALYICLGCCQPALQCRSGGP